MRLADLRAISLKQWLVAVAGGVVIACAVLTTSWVVRHGSAIQKLNRGVGDTLFLAAGGRPWFRLDERRRDVPLEAISTSFKDAVSAVEDHRFYLHPGIDPVALVDRLRGRDCPGVDYVPTRFRPAFGKHAGAIVDGVYLRVYDATSVPSVRLGVSSPGCGPSTELTSGSSP